MLINYINIELLESKYKNRKKLYNDLITLHTGLLATTSDDNTDKNEEVFGLGDFDGHQPVGEHDDFQFDFIGEAGLEDQVVFEEDVEMETLNNRDGATRHIRHWVSRTITPQPVDFTIYSVNTTLRDNVDPDDV